MIDAGALRHAMVLQRMSVTQTSFRESVQSPVFVADLWAEVLRESSAEFQLAKGQHVQMTHLLRIRYRSDVTNAHRLVWGARILNIQSVIDEDARKHFLRLICVEHGG